MDDLANFEIVGLVSKVLSEAQNHLGVADKNLAEFLIAQRLSSDTFDAFEQKMTGMGGDSLPGSFLQSIDRLICLMHPAMKSKMGFTLKVPQDTVVDDGLALPGKIRTHGCTKDNLTDRRVLEPKADKCFPRARPRGRGRGRSRSSSPWAQERRFRGHDLGQGLFILKARDDGRQGELVPEGIRHDRKTDDSIGYQPKTVPDFGSSANAKPLGRRGMGRYNATGTLGPDIVARPPKRLTSPERWEIRQLIAAGVAKASDYPNLGHNAEARENREMELEIELDIEVRDEEPPFLVGQARQSLELSPIRVVKAPDGSLNRAALSGATLAKERAELRHQQPPVAVSGEAASKWGSSILSTQWHNSPTSPSEFKGSKSINKPDDSRIGKRTEMTLAQQRESLPIFSFRDQLIDAVRQNQILIVVGETGSGKTTQLTQYLAEAGFANTGIVGCTQPRRVAAISVATRVAEEVGCVLGEEVGYSVRFDDCTSPATRIKFMTDGTLQREILVDSSLSKYSVIILDEAHERTVATDVLFALLKRALKKRPDLKVISTSATLDAEKFSSYFNNAPIFTISGRAFPVEVMYSREPQPDYLDATLTTVMEIHLTEPSGDILLFLTGQEEIDTSCEILNERLKAIGPGVPGLLVLPMYSALPPDMQRRIFEPAPPGIRKAILATNVAEASITIDNIHYVVDPGFAKQDAYDAKLGMDSLIVTPISQAQANQRAGRAGRTGPGKCFRLYTEAAYQSEMLPSPIPAIQRQNVSATILMLKAMGINDPLRFNFMDPPPINAMLGALEELYALGALDDEGLLTRLGRRIADFPLDTSLAKVLIVAADMGCSDEMLSIVAMLNLPNVFYRPKEKQSQADEKKAKFHDPSGDHLTLLNVYNAWKQSGYATSWCFEHFVLARSMRQAKDVRTQLVKLMERYRLPIVSCGREMDLIRRALCAGYFRNAARRETRAGGSGNPTGVYKTVVQGTEVYVHPSSALCERRQNRPPAEWVVYHGLVLTSREYMHWTSSVEPEWLVQAAPTFFRLAGADGRVSKRRMAERAEPLHDRFGGTDEWRLSARSNGVMGGRWTFGKSAISVRGLSRDSDGCVTAEIAVVKHVSRIVRKPILFGSHDIDA